jgi:hypothetical protein
MDISISGTLLAFTLLFGHVIAVAVTALVAYGVLNVMRRQPEITYLFWPAFIGGSVAWGYTARRLVTSSLPFSAWSDSAFSWYGFLMVGGLVIGILLQRRRM